MKVRALSAQDAIAYQELRLRALRESPTAFAASCEEEKDRTEGDVAPLLAVPEDGSRCVFGTFDGDELVGFVAFVRPRRKKLRHVAEVAGTYVVPESRRQGVGAALLEALLAHARSLDGVRQLRLGVSAGNAAAIRLYEAVGFTRYGVEPDALCIDGVFHDEELYSLRL